jgi:hypothetical protein
VLSDAIQCASTTNADRFTKRQLEQLDAIWEHEALEKTELARDLSSEPANRFRSMFDGGDNVDRESEEDDGDDDDGDDDDVSGCGCG